MPEEQVLRVLETGKEGCSHQTRTDAHQRRMEQCPAQQPEIHRRRDNSKRRTDGQSDPEASGAGPNPLNHTRERTKS